MTMTRDPDLDQAIDELEMTTHRIRAVEGQLVHLDEIKDYQTLARRKHDLADLKGEIAARAERLVLDPRALLLIVEEANRLRKAMRRRPTVAQLDTALLNAGDIAERDRSETAAAVVVARNQHAHVMTRVNAIVEARRYLEASR